MPVVINGTTGITTPTESVATTVGVGGATPAASGAGITFPATQSASSDANTLDDYEEGTWTPTVQGNSSAGTTTYSIRDGRYVKIGRSVTATCRVEYTSATGTGYIMITGLPFTNSSGVDSVGSVMTNGLNWPVSGSITLYLGGGTSFEMYISTDDGGWAIVNLSNEAAGIIATMTYQTS